MRTQKEYFDIGLQGLLRDKNYRDLGKLFAEPNEYFQKDWINENCSFASKYSKYVNINRLANRTSPKIKTKYTFK